MTRQSGTSLVAGVFPVLAALLLLATSTPSWGQPKEKEPEIPQPEAVKIEVKADLAKLPMICTYYPSWLGKEAIPILMLHGYKGSRADYHYLATYLQQQGHAVIVPDLRGHGDSTVLNLANGADKELLAEKMAKRDFEALVRDVNAIKSWIRQKNNDDELNMEMLTLVAADMTCVTAMNFAMLDWNTKELLNYKNCRDVKALVLLSPDQNYRGTSMQVAMKHPVVGHELSVMIAVGKKDSGALSEAKRLVTTLERQHGESSDEKRGEEKEVVFYAADTNLQGTDLVQKNLDVAPIIAKFIQFRVQAFADKMEHTARIQP